MKTIQKLCSATLFVALVPLGMAQTWNGGGSDNNWSTDANWAENSAPTNATAASQGIAIVFEGSTKPAVTVDAPVAFNTLTVKAGAAAFTLSGSELTLYGASPDGGTTIRNESSNLLTINNNIKFGSQSGIRAQSGDITLNGDINIGTVTTRILASTGRTVTINGKITSGTSGSIAYNGGRVIINSDNADSYTRTNTEIWNSEVFANNNAAFGSSTVRFGSDGSNTLHGKLYANAGMTIANELLVRSKAGTNTGTNSATIGGQHTTGVSTFSGILRMGDASGNQIFGVTLTAAEGGRVNFTGNVRRGSGSGDGDTVTKTGGGIVALEGSDNNYSGTTTVSEGAFLVNGTLAFGGAAVSVASGATLGGKGAINRSVTVADGGILSAGDINDAGTSLAETLTFGNGLVLGTTSLLKFDLGSASDLIAITGDLTLAGLLDVTAGDGFGVGNYTLFSFTGTVIDNGLTINTTPAGFDYSISIGVNEVTLHVAAVPEPSTISLVAGGLVLVFGVSRRFIRRNTAKL